MPPLPSADLVYLLPETAKDEAGLRRFLSEHPEIRFISLVAVDLGGNDTDEKIPVTAFLRDANGFLNGAIQTDGSSVVLPGIATLNNGKIDFVTDPAAAWYVDYNWDLIDPKSGLSLGTLRIPSFLVHGGRRVDSRSVLARAVSFLDGRVRAILQSWPELCRSLGFAAEEIAEILPTAATELEFWVRTPGHDVGVEELAASQALQEQYWKRTKGSVRSALEASLILLEQYGLHPEMGHKEVGGVKARITGEGNLDDIMEQLEIDWRFDTPLQAADNELLARITIKETFRRFGLEVTFAAKPITDVAGSGEHTHLGLAVRLKDGRISNIFTPARRGREYLTPLGWGSLFGLLKHWPTIGALVTATNEGLDRLQPGFEAPVCPVAAIGPAVDTVSRNRTVLIGLVRDMDRPAATRFEVRAPSPHTNTYLALAGFYQAMIDGMQYVASHKMHETELLAEFNKAAGEKAGYLPVERAFRSEDDVFEHYGAEERTRLFGRAPATVWETLSMLGVENESRRLLYAGDVFPAGILDGYTQAMLARWRLELREKILPIWSSQFHECLPGHTPGDAEAKIVWEDIEAKKRAIHEANLLGRLRRSLLDGDDRQASDLQIALHAALTDLRRAYQLYWRWHCPDSRHAG